MKQISDMVNLVETNKPIQNGNGTPGLDPLSLHVVEDWETFMSLRECWDCLVEASFASVFQTHEWLSLWWLHFGKAKNHKLHIILFYHNDILVGISPTFVERQYCFGLSLHQRLCMIGSGTAFRKSFGVFLDDGPSDYLDFIILPEYEQRVGEAFLKHLRTSLFYIDDIEFVNVQEESHIRTTIVPLLEKQEFTSTISRADVCPYIDVPTSLDNYLRALSSNARRRLSQAWKATNEENLFNLCNVNSIAEYQQALAYIINLHQQRWNRMGYPGLFADSNFLNFQKYILKEFFDKGWLWCKTAIVGNRCIAARLAFKFNGSFYDYLSGFDDNAAEAKRRPGIAIILAMIKDAIQNNYHTLDLLRGDEQYKFDMTQHTTFNWNIVIVVPQQRNPIKYFLSRFVKALYFGLFLIRRELKLMHVQHQQHGFPKSIIHYFDFRTSRLTRKVKNIVSKNRMANG